jgi:hypothetical protein
MDSNPWSLSGMGAKLAHKQLRHGPVGLVDRCVGVGCGSGIGIGDRDRAETGSADPVRCLPLLPIRFEQRVVLVGITVRPAIDRDRSDVARRVEAPELYLRFTLSYRDVEKLLAERGLARRTPSVRASLED